jgi:hypothetical protein
MGRIDFDAKTVILSIVWNANPSLVSCEEWDDDGVSIIDPSFSPGFIPCELSVRV